MSESLNDTHSDGADALLLQDSLLNLQVIQGDTARKDRATCGLDGVVGQPYSKELVRELHSTKRVVIENITTHHFIDAVLLDKGHGRVKAEGVQRLRVTLLDLCGRKGLVGKCESRGAVLGVELCLGFLLKTALTSPTEDNASLGGGSEARVGGCGNSVAVGMARSGKEGFNIRLVREACLHVGLNTVFSFLKVGCLF
jgi:hypothetical protein